MGVHMAQRAHRQAHVVRSVSRHDELLAAGSHALETEGDLQRARGWFERAYELAERVPDPDAMAAAALGLGGLWVHEQRSVTAGAMMEQRLSRALSLVDPRSCLAV